MLLSICCTRPPAALRCPEHPLLQSTCHALRRPLTMCCRLQDWGADLHSASANQKQHSSITSTALTSAGSPKLLQQLQPTVSISGCPVVNICNRSTKYCVQTIPSPGKCAAMLPILHCAPSRHLIEDVQSQLHLSNLDTHIQHGAVCVSVEGYVTCSHFADQLQSDGQVHLVGALSLQQTIDGMQNKRLLHNMQSSFSSQRLIPNTCHMSTAQQLLATAGPVELLLEHNC